MCHVWAQVIICMQERAAPDWLKKWKLYGDSRRVAKSSNCQRVCSAYRSFCGEPIQKVKGASRRAANRAAKAAAAAQAAMSKSGDTCDAAAFKRDATTAGLTPAGPSKEYNLLEEFLSSVKLQDKVRRILQIIKIIDEGLADKVHVKPSSSSSVTSPPSSSLTSPSIAGRKLQFKQVVCQFPLYLSILKCIIILLQYYYLYFKIMLA